MEGKNRLIFADRLKGGVGVRDYAEEARVQNELENKTRTTSLFAACKAGDLAAVEEALGPGRQPQMYALIMGLHRGEPRSAMRGGWRAGVPPGNVSRDEFFADGGCGC